MDAQREAVALQDKLARIQAQIDSGCYRIDMDALVDSLLPLFMSDEPKCHECRKPYRRRRRLRQIS